MKDGDKNEKMEGVRGGVGENKKWVITSPVELASVNNLEKIFASSLSTSL